MTAASISKTAVTADHSSFLSWHFLGRAVTYDLHPENLSSSVMALVSFYCAGMLLVGIMLLWLCCTASPQKNTRRADFMSLIANIVTNLQSLCFLTIHYEARLLFDEILAVILVNVAIVSYYLLRLRPFLMGRNLGINMYVRHE